MRVLYLALKKEPFEVMITREKKEEFRRASKWMLSRLINKQYDLIKLVNGYGKEKPYFVAEYKGWEYITNNTRRKYSNGLEVNAEAGSIRIHIGEIVCINGV